MPSNEELHPHESVPPPVPETGRLGVYTQHADEIDLLVLQCGASGYSYAQTAACIGISTQTLMRWGQQSPRFSSVLDRAHTLSQAWWEGRAMDGTANGLIGASVWAKSMAARFRHDYTDSQNVQVTSPDGSMSPNRPLSAEELAKELEKRGLPIPDLN